MPDVFLPMSQGAMLSFKRVLMVSVEDEIMAGGAVLSLR
jgi:hypothetical protein